MFLDLSPPDWPTLVGGTKESSWITARDRKVIIAATIGRQFLTVARRLEERGATFECTPQVLREIPDAAKWFLALTGLSDKTLSNIRSRPERFGLAPRPETVARKLAEGQEVDEPALTSFANWINWELQGLYPLDSRTPELALSTVLLILGARIQGQVQNMAGDDAVLLLKRLLITGLEKRGLVIEASRGDGVWAPYAPDLDLQAVQQLRFGTRLICEFVPGGNRPDIKVMISDVVIAVGEVKGRKDLSNLWESWMPQVNGHLRTWTSDHPDAARLFFGTIITDEMIEGVTAVGTRQAGLRVLHKNGLLTTAYNLSLVDARSSRAVAAFDGLLDALSDLTARDGGG